MEEDVEIWTEMIGLIFHFFSIFRHDLIGHQEYSSG